MPWEKFEKLDFISITQDSSRSCVVLFHGYGADAQDLASLARMFQLDESVDWFFPNGLLKVSTGLMASGRAWFELRVNDLEDINDGVLRDNSLSQAQLETLTLVSRWLNNLGHLYDQVYIGGFSQGAILTSHVFYRLNFSPKALLLLSGYLVSQSTFPVIPEPLQVPFFQCHGKQDQVLALSGARKLFEQLIQLGLHGQWLEFPGGHEIPMEVISQLQTFLNSSLKRQA